MDYDPDDVDYGDLVTCHGCEEHTTESRTCEACDSVLCIGCCEYAEKYDGAKYDKNGAWCCSEDCAMTPEERERAHGSERESERSAP